MHVLLDSILVSEVKRGRESKGLLVEPRVSGACWSANYPADIAIDSVIFCYHSGRSRVGQVLMDSFLCYWSGQSRRKYLPWRLLQAHGIFASQREGETWA